MHSQTYNGLVWKFKSATFQGLHSVVSFGVDAAVIPSSRTYDASNSKGPDRIILQLWYLPWDLHKSENPSIILVLRLGSGFKYLLALSQKPHKLQHIDPASVRDVRLRYSGCHGGSNGSSRSHFQY